ncbi:glycoside hydrolase family 2 TIM barrel-domain containing protein [Paenibacillus sp. HW567]|uniref:glycoside hydrolase family 2 TIM barrel-domain containing protein n=1 Tax=Paenibacillus sp. HW567 TaxID=1034769 RepID=UPI0003749CAE|nr:glycoside hydrolase family 2 TIM barrel-domain containing protein [Paenibacillus sp. HW567]
MCLLDVKNVLVIFYKILNDYGDVYGIVYLLLGVIVNMYSKINLEGVWKLQLDTLKQGLSLPFQDSITLPGTTSYARKGTKNKSALVGALTDEYPFEGYAWFSREVEIPEHLAGSTCYLYLERTRVTTIWLDGREAGTQNSLNTPHLYELKELARGTHTLTIRVDNTDYPTKGGHLTSPDTQTNWNGITGRMELQFFKESYLKDIQVYTDIRNRSVRITSRLEGEMEGVVTVSARSCNTQPEHTVMEQVFRLSGKDISIDYVMGKDALLWSDESPNLYMLTVNLKNGNGEVLDRHEILTGLRDFRADGDKFTINGAKTFLRGKHDGLIFPLTGYAPTTVEEWLRVLGISKSYGINHYRFHTCCPPEAAFTAADRLGIYMEPELPFWGTITEESDEQHNQEEQDYLISEGYAILQAFGNHPSFVMMSMGNELWGSKSRIDGFLKDYKAFDNRHLYTQGSNNHQWVPSIQAHDDFFCGVRFSGDRLFRGSYAMCDAPLGHVQTDVPGTMTDYDAQIIPADFHSGEEAAEESDGSVQIQFGTEAKTVKVSDAATEWIPHIPVISHEIGQYATYPNFDEIEKYRGPLKAENFKIFRERLEQKGLGHLAAKYFECSGQLAVACYKEELEAAFRSRKLAGFQLLDLQDFSGQGTALVGILDAFMDSKGLITPEEWRTFCSNAVLMARFGKFNYVSEELFNAHIELICYQSKPLGRVDLYWELSDGQKTLADGTAGVSVPEGENYIDICDLAVNMPAVDNMTQVVLSLRIGNTDIRKSYDLWIYPKHVPVDTTGVHWFEELSGEALSLLEQGENVVLMPKPESLSNAIEGFYSTDFWCYPMFRSISESMNRPVPVGTMGLLIRNEHPVFRHFPCNEYSTYPWWSIVSHSRSLIMDGTGSEWNPIVQTIDNFERNHKLGLLFECKVGPGNLLVCPLDTVQAADTPEGRQFLFSLLSYVKSAEFQPSYEIGVSELLTLVK